MGNDTCLYGARLYGTRLVKHTGESATRNFCRFLVNRFETICDCSVAYKTVFAPAYY